MKKIFLIGILLVSLQESFACDICGCSSGNYFIGPFPNFHKHFLGVRYTFRSFNSQVADDQTEFSKDFYQSAELWGGWNIGRKWQTIVFVPYNINRQISDDGTKQSNGLGDISAILNYKLFSKKNTGKPGRRITQELSLGGGVKLPTGRFSANPDDIIPDANNQPGTGSIDLLLNAMYYLQINTYRFNSNVNYKINNSADKFQFGNRLSVSSFASRSFATRLVTFSPNVGLMYENLQANKLEKLKIEDTGGNVLLAAAGMETSLNKMIIGFNVQLPLSQDLSNGQTNTKIRGMAHVTFTF